MVYTVTFNPSLDYIIMVNDFELGRTNRTTGEKLFPGGKGLNVSMVLSNLGIENTAFGFVAGFTGDEIVRRMEEKGCKTDFIRLQNGISRINVKLQSMEGTEINGQGPVITKEEVQMLMQKLDMLQKDDYLVLAGSIPSTMDKDCYQSIMEHLKEKEIKIVVDATGELLYKVLKYHPFLIKPNHHELGELFGVDIGSREEIVRYAGKLQEMGAVNVLVSMASEGAILVDENGMVYQTRAPKGKVVNAVGAGDSMVAGFLESWIHEKNYEKAFYRSVAAGSASAFSEELATKKAIDNLNKKISIFDENI